MKLRLVGAQQAALRTLSELAHDELQAWRGLGGFLRRRAECEARHARELAACWSRGGEDAIDAIAAFFTGLVEDEGEGPREQRPGSGASPSNGLLGSVRDGLGAVDVGLAREAEAGHAAAAALSAVAAEAEEGVKEHESRLHEAFARGVRELRLLNDALIALGHSRDAFYHWGHSRCAPRHPHHTSCGLALPP